MPALTTQRALISASDKLGLVSLARRLHQLNIEILATDGTATSLISENIPVTAIADYTGSPEILSGRVKTLHPKIHAGILARRGIDDETLKAEKIPLIDIVIVNLYPFQQTPNIENIDIGGPTLLRAAAKNFADVTVVVDPNDYDRVMTEIETQGNTTLETRRYLAQKVFDHIAEYDLAIANYFHQEKETFFPTFYKPVFKKIADLRYGENPHQTAAFYQNEISQPGSLAHAKQQQGSALSFNNLMDTECAWNCINEFNSEKASCVIVKHATPCAVAQGDTLLKAYQQAYSSDPESAFGGIIAFNQILDEATARQISEQFAEVIIAPDIDSKALELFSKKTKLRVLTTGKLLDSSDTVTLHSISGGLLIQESNRAMITQKDCTVVTKKQPSEQQWQDLLFAWKVVKHVKSNAIVYAKHQRTLGIGGGQTSRVFSAEIGILKAQKNQLSLHDAVMASDAFFPFADGLQVGINAGISAIIQPGGSVRDSEVIDAANKANIVMIFTHERHFRH